MLDFATYAFVREVIYPRFQLKYQMVSQNEKKMLGCDGLVTMSGGF